MALIGPVAKSTARVQKIYIDKVRKYDYTRQYDVLKKLVEKSKDTELGKEFDFKRILKEKELHQFFSELVPIYDYDSFYDAWLHRTLDGEQNVFWGEKIKYFALSSGTSGAPSKRIPVSKSMINKCRKIGVSQLSSFYDLKMPTSFYEKNVLMLSGSTELKKVGDHYEGDLSGILVGNTPKWFSRFKKPGNKIAQIENWDEKIEAIVEAAPNWDIGILSGFPSWFQILIKKILDRYEVDDIHQIWPNYKIFMHGGVHFEPYRQTFESFSESEIYYLNTYLASEGFFAFQRGLHSKGMQLLLNSGVYFEFVPFNEENFDENGKVKQGAEAIKLKDVQKNVEYAMLISTASGLWRYLIGDTIKFTSLINYEIEIVGRTNNYLNICGEHISADNLIQAVTKVCETLKINIQEFSVSAGEDSDGFYHNWYIGQDYGERTEETIVYLLDKYLKELNDDYATERKYVLKKINLKCYPTNVFYDFLKSIGKNGSQNKFPTVLKGKRQKEWEDYLSQIYGPDF